MFSVVMPLWNKRATVARSVASVLSQDYGRFELIIVDDGSTDGSLESIADVADPRMRILCQPNAGPGPARNRGIAEAQHDWIAFLDADDLWFPGHLAELERARNRHPEAALIGTAFIHSDFRGRFHPPLEQEGRIEPVSYLEAIGAGDHPFCTSSAAARASVLRQIGGFGSFGRGEDSELWVRIDLNHRIVRSTRATVVYIHGTKGITETLRKPWPGSVPSAPEDLSPAVAAALAAYGSQPLHLRAAIDSFVNRYVDWMLQGSAAHGDASAVRAITTFRRGPAPLDHRLLALAAHLPRPLACAAFRLVQGFTARLGKRIS